MYQIPGFQFIKRNRTTGKGGGVAVYISNNIKWKRKNNFENSNIESVWIEITPNKSKSFFVGCVYRPPDSSCHLSKEWNNIFSLDLANIFDCEKETIVVGDFNVNYLKRADHREVKDIFNGHGLTQLIKDPTRVTSSSSTLIDLIFTNKPCNISKSTVLPLSLSDHDAILCVRKLNNSKPQQKEVSSRNYRNYDENVLENDLRQSDWDYFYSCTDVNKAWESFKNIFLTTLNHHAPVVTKRIKGRPCPWLSADIKSTMDQRDKILRKARKSGKDFYWNSYKSLRNRCNNMIKNAKKRYHTELLKDNAKNPSKFWKTVKDVFPTKEKPINYVCIKN